VKLQLKAVLLGLTGIAIVLETMTRLDCDRLTVSDHGLREGLLADLALRAG